MGLKVHSLFSFCSASAHEALVLCPALCSYRVRTHLTYSHSLTVSICETRMTVTLPSPMGHEGPETYKVFKDRAQLSISDFS